MFRGIESYPWGPSLSESGWLALPWLLTENASEIPTPEDTTEHIDAVKYLLEKSPNVINEIDSLPLFRYDSVVAYTVSQCMGVIKLPI